MKINKYNLLHWYYLIKTVYLLLLCLPIRYFLKKENTQKKVILYGHKLHGNLASLYDYSNCHDISGMDIYYFTLDPDYYNKINSKPNILGSNLKDILNISLSDCIISDHGLHSLIILFYFTRIKFIDVWHGIPFKGFTPEDFKLQHQYTETWVSSSYLKEIYIKLFGFSEEKVYVTGYGRCDLLQRNILFKEILKNKYNIDKNKKIILFAPTWKQDNKKRNEVPFGYSEKEFTEKLDLFLKHHNAVMLLRYHLNTLKNQTNNQSNIIYFPSSLYPYTEEIIAISDILITDWSSIAFDMMVLKKPVLFLDVETPFKNGFSIAPEYRAGSVISHFSQLENELEHAINSESDYMKKHANNYNHVTQLVYDNTLESKSVIRYVNRLNKLLEIPST